MSRVVPAWLHEVPAGTRSLTSESVCTPYPLSLNARSSGRSVDRAAPEAQGSTVTLLLPQRCHRGRAFDDRRVPRMPCPSLTNSGNPAEVRATAHILGFVPPTGRDDKGIVLSPAWNSTQRHGFYRSMATALGVVRRLRSPATSRRSTPPSER
jgi:hypothetical protein